MAPMKFEDTVKERLEQRRIEPSEGAWDRIAGKLETQEVVKKSHRTLWLAIAASFVGGVIATLIIINNPAVSTTANEIVTNTDTTATEQLPAVDEAKNIELIADQSPVLQTQEEENPSGGVEKKTIAKSNTPVRVDKIVTAASSAVANTTTQKVTKERATAMVSENQKVASEQAVAVVQNKELKNAIDQQLDQMVSKVDLNAVTDAEIDSLLRSAQREIISQQAFQTTATTVDAEALLLDVEAEVDPASFKDKIFEALSDGFKIARDAVADRNN